MTAGMPPGGTPETEGNAAQPRRGCSCVLVGLVAVVAVAAVFVFLRATAPSPHPPHHSCLSNVKSIALAFQMYAYDNDDTYPPAEGWCDRLYYYVVKTDRYRCPTVPELDAAFAYNAALGAAWLPPADPDSLPSSDHARTIVVFESDAGWNAAGGPELLPDVPRHLGGDHYGFADGSARWLKRKQLPDGSWAKEPEADVIWEPVVEAYSPVSHTFP